MSTEYERLINAYNKAKKYPDNGKQNVSQALRDLGTYHDNESEYKQAIQYYKNNLNLWTKNLTNRRFLGRGNDIQTRRRAAKKNMACANHDISLTYKYMERYAQAEKYGLQYLKLLETVSGSNSSDMAIPLISLIKIYSENNDVEKKIEYQRKLINLCDRNMEVKQIVEDEIRKQCQPNMFYSSQNTDITEINYIEHIEYLADTADILLQRKINRLYKCGQSKNAIQLCKNNIDKGILSNRELYFRMITIKLSINDTNYLELAQDVEKYFIMTGLINNYKLDQIYNNNDEESIKQLNLINCLKLYDKFDSVKQTLLSSIFSSARLGITSAENVGMYNLAKDLRIFFGTKKDQNPFLNLNLNENTNIQDTFNQLMQNLNLTNSNNPLITDPLNIYKPGTCGNLLCNNLQSKDEDFKKCGRCQKIAYCTRECQIEHWKQGHKKLCNKK